MEMVAKLQNSGQVKYVIIYKNSFPQTFAHQYDSVASMNKSRLEAFSDGLFSVVITIMVLELNPPGDVTWQSLKPLIPIFLSYVLSFVYGAIFWINHHHLLAVTRRVNSVVYAGARTRTGAGTAGHLRYQINHFLVAKGIKLI